MPAEREKKFHFLKSKKSHSLVSLVEVEIIGTETLFWLGAIQERHSMLLPFLGRSFICLPSSISFSPPFFFSYPHNPLDLLIFISLYPATLLLHLRRVLGGVSHWADDGLFNTLVFPTSDLTNQCLFFFPILSSFHSNVHQHLLKLEANLTDFLGHSLCLSSLHTDTYPLVVWKYSWCDTKLTLACNYFTFIKIELPETSKKHNVLIFLTPLLFPSSWVS